MLKNKGFLALLAAQFLGVFNDTALVMVVTFFVNDTVQNFQKQNEIISLANGLFYLPFLLFSTYAGTLADRVSKRRVAIGVKIAEGVVACLGILALHFHHMPFILFVVFLMGLHSTFYGPAKYGILPEMFEEKDLSRANGIVQFITFMGVIFGTASGGFITQWAKPEYYWAGAIFLAVAVVSAFISFFITPVAAARPEAAFDWNPVHRFWQDLKKASKDKALFLSLMGTGYFWLVAVFFKMNLFLFGPEMLHTNEVKTSALLASVAVGIGLGSLLAGKISGDKVELGLVPMGSIGLGLALLDMSRAAPSFNHTAVDVFFVGIASGFFTVPLTALIQIRSPKSEKGQMMGLTNIINFLGMTLAAVVNYILGSLLHLNPAQSILVVALGTLAATGYVFWLLPAAFIRLVLWLLTHTLYRVKTVDYENFPPRGGALLVSNHVSYADPFLLSAAVPRRVRFFMWRKIYDFKPLTWFFRLMGGIPISASDGAKKFMASMEIARQALRDGHVVCIFAEGAITRLAQTLGFRKGLEIIAKDLDIPIVPVHLDRVWGSIFSFQGGSFIWKFPRQIPYPVTVSFGKPMPSASKAHEVRQAVLELGTRAFEQRIKELRPLHSDFLRRAKGQWFSKAIADSTGMELTYGKTVAAAFLMARRFKKLFPGEKQVGVMLPPCVPATLVNVALSLAGKIPVNINFTLSQNLVKEIIEEAEIRHVLTSQKMLEALPWEPDDRMVCLEKFSRPSKIKGLFTMICLMVFPVSLWEKLFLRESLCDMEDPATLIFTSGSTGVPKGVILTHANIQSNLQGIIEVFQMTPRDTLIGVLPFFHSFGYTAAMWFPLLGGFSAAYHRSPLETTQIQKLIKEHGGTATITTPTFLQMWMKKFKKEDIQSLRFVLTGAEKLRPSVSQAFTENFGVPVIEGYGCTELSPVACASVLHVEDGQEFQLGHKPGKVGRPLPGVSVRVVDLETGARVQPTGVPGLLLVKGLNVMKGYWKDPEKTAEVIKDGWYITGDMASVDEDGFVEITDRLSRFSKIGGEMVPHLLIEERLAAAAGNPESRFLVMSVEDKSKGESLVVLYNNFEGGVEDLLEKLKASDTPKLWIPDRRNFFKVEEWPTLGSGKVDMAKAKELINGLRGFTGN